MPAAVDAVPLHLFVRQQQRWMQVRMGLQDMLENHQKRFKEALAKAGQAADVAAKHQLNE